MNEYYKNVGERLRKVIESENATGKKLKQSYFYKKYMYNDIGSAKTLFSMYLKGERHIPMDLIISIAEDELVQIDVGYLTGSDRFECDSYEHFKAKCTIDKAHAEIEEFEKHIVDERTAFEQILKLCNVSDFQKKYNPITERVIKSFSDYEKYHYFNRIQQWIEFNVLQPHYTTLTPSQRNEIMKESPQYKPENLWDDETDDRPIGIIAKEKNISNISYFYDKAIIEENDKRNHEEEWQKLKFEQAKKSDLKEGDSMDE